MCVHVLWSLRNFTKLLDFAIDIVAYEVSKLLAYTASYTLKSLPVADPSSLNTLTVMSVVDGLLRINTSCTEPLSSSVLYTDWLKFTMGAKNNRITRYKL